jgi:hypothetical protein
MEAKQNSTRDKVKKRNCFYLCGHRLPTFCSDDIGCQKQTLRSTQEEEEQNFKKLKN